METIKLRDEFIKLGQALVNGEVDTRRGKKLYDGDVVTFNGEEIKIEK